MKMIVMYSKANCPFCKQAEILLKHRGVTQITIYRVDTNPDFLAEMMSRTSRRTVPQIYLGDIHVGGYDELVALDRQGQLAILLSPES
ncbi:MAG: glutaredoxin 3 [Pseudomonadales bacterium]|nr:glutaredoxin 3 [Pseudomonadales bacterium]